MGLKVSQKPVIFMQPGPLRLFWTTGVYYFWELKDRYDFVLLVPDEYADSDTFRKIAALPQVLHVEYMPGVEYIVGTRTPWVMWRRGRYYARTFKRLLAECNADALLVPDLVYISNLYLLHCCRAVAPEIKCYMYQNGFKLNLVESSHYNLHCKLRVEKLMNKFRVPRGKRRLAEAMLDLKDALFHFLEYKLFPYFLLGTAFSPYFRRHGYKVDQKAIERINSDINTTVLTYLDGGAKIFRRGGLANVIQADHPLKTCARQVYEFLYEPLKEGGGIILLPTGGLIYSLIALKHSPDEVVELITEGWAAAVESLSARLPGVRIKLKLHPAFAEDQLWRQITRSLSESAPNLQIVPPGENAEKLIVESRFVLGDISTTLWWAGMCGDKVVFSLDIFGYPAGGDMKRYEEILYYVDDVEQLRRIPFEPKLAGEEGAPISSII